MSNTMYETQAEPVASPSGNSKGCLFGCLIAFGLMFSLVVCMGVGGYWFFTNQVQKYTAQTPLELPTVQYEPEELAELQSRLKSFESAVDTGAGETNELVLTADDINALIADQSEMKGKVFIKIEEGKVTGDVSVPTDMIPGGKGRYFNGSATLDASMEDGILIVTLVDAEVNGEKLPQQFIDGIGNENLAKDMYKNAENAKTLRRFEDVRIEGDKVILTLKPTDDAELTEEVDQPVEVESDGEVDVTNDQAETA